MKNIFLLGLAGLFLLGCAARQNSANEAFNKETASIANETPKADSDKDTKTENSSPLNSEIRGIDFRNFTYPEGIKVENGRLDLSEKPLSRQEYAVKDIQYADLTRDAGEDALVDLTTLMGGGSTTYQHGFHLFTLEKGKPRLVWRLTTGSEADCGLKEMWLDDDKLFLEVFGKCHIEKNALKNENYTTDVNAENFTRLTFGWNGREFGQENLEVFPFPENNFQRYERKTGKN